MSKVFCITNRKLCQGDFLKRIEQIAACRPDGVILREKDLHPEEYAIHLPLHLLKRMSKEEKEHFSILGASCHSIEEALEAQMLGCTYITAGHVFETDCKKGIPGRGIEFLHKVCEAVNIPVYGIGGIDRNNISQIRTAGAQGVCLMNSLMISDDIVGLIKNMEGKDEI